MALSVSHRNAASQPPVAEEYVERESKALDDAISRVEGEHAAAAAAAAVEAALADVFAIPEAAPEPPPPPPPPPPPAQQLQRPPPQRIQQQRVQTKVRPKPVEREREEPEDEGQTELERAIQSRDSGDMRNSTPRGPQGPQGGQRGTSISDLIYEEEDESPQPDEENDRHRLKPLPRRIRQDEDKYIEADELFSGEPVEQQRKEPNNSVRPTADKKKADPTGVKARADELARARELDDKQLGPPSRRPMSDRRP